MDVADLLMLSTALVAVAALVFFAVRINDDWASMTGGWRLVRLSVLLLLLVMVVGPIEITLLAQDVPLGLRHMMSVVSCVGLLGGLWLIRAEDHSQSPGWLKVSEVNAILDHVEDTHHNEPCHNPGCLAARVALREKIAAAERGY